MNILVITIHIIVCFVLIVVILLQGGRGQGLSGGGFGGNVQSLLGTKSSAFMTKATTVCAILFLFTCIGLNILEVQKSRSLFRGPGNQAPLDVEQIKKALEKIKQIDPATAAASAKAIQTGKSATVATTTAGAEADATQLAETVTNEVAATALPEATKP